ncbi:hypothetical protein CF327_g5383 [Tilletia walkeri]|uniref:Inhibitor of growth protein N-terminal histone-binding domain-containing protein n=1 Tax=Tilletia walkeri TaxID=117179 RepID=A0A8X7T145_9BASI|nr:hypothetical protein CF327_g5383 [Tilletia walkeri]KAE8263098.1 hypothetical protein A4X09_0g7317 [Tilletia walkeri]
MKLAFPLILTAFLFAAGSMAAVAPQPLTEAPSAVLADRSISTEHNPHSHDEFAKDLAQRDDIPPLTKEDDEILNQVFLDFQGDLTRMQNLLAKHDATKEKKENVLRIFRQHLEADTKKVKGIAAKGAGAKGGKHPRDMVIKGRAGPMGWSGGKGGASGKGGSGGKGGAISKGGEFPKGGAGSKGGKHPRDEVTMVRSHNADVHGLQDLIVEVKLMTANRIPDLVGVLTDLLEALARLLSGR